MLHCARFLVFQHRMSYLHFLVLQRHSPAVHIVDLGTSPCNVKPRKRLSDENIDSQVKDAKVPMRDQCFSRNSTPCKKLFPTTPSTTQRPVAMVSPITMTTVKTEPQQLKKKNMLTPGPRLPLVVNSPNVSLESAL